MQPRAHRWVPPGRLHAVALLSLLLHLAVIVTWLQARRPAGRMEPPRMTVRIVAAPLGPPAGFRLDTAPPAQRETVPKPAVVRLAAPRPARAVPGEGTAAAREVPAPPSATGPDPAMAPLNVPPEASTQPPLPSATPPPIATPSRLDLAPPMHWSRAASSPSVREQALDDARANPRPTTPEARLAQNLGADTVLREEALGPDRRRFRRGTACIEAHSTRIARLNPFDDRFRDLQVAKPCD